VHLEASTKPHVHQKFEIFWTNIASTMAYPNFKNGPKKGLGPLGVKQYTTPSIKHPKLNFLVISFIRTIHLDSIYMQEFIFLFFSF
jgi:hypothetical protein